MANKLSSVKTVQCSKLKCYLLTGNERTAKIIASKALLQIMNAKFTIEGSYW